MHPPLLSGHALPVCLPDSESTEEFKAGLEEIFERRVPAIVPSGNGGGVLLRGEGCNGGQARMLTLPDGATALEVDVRHPSFRVVEVYGMTRHDMAMAIHDRLRAGGLLLVEGAVVEDAGEVG